MGKYYHNIDGVISDKYFLEMLEKRNIDQCKEIKKCINSTEYLFNTYGKITTQNGIITPKSTEFQNIIFDEYHNSKFIVGHKSRQIGGTVALVATVYNYILSNFDKTISIIGGDSFMDKFRLFYVNLPDFLKIGVTKFDKRRISFSNGCRMILHSIKSQHPAIGYTPDYLIIDEFNYMNSVTRKWVLQGLVPTFNARINSKLFLISVPNGDKSFVDLLDINEIMGFSKIFSTEDFIRSRKRDNKIKDIIK